MSKLIETNKKDDLRNSRKILVVGVNGLFSDNLMNHCVQVAGRLGCDLAALGVDVQNDGPEFEKRVLGQALKLCEHADRNGIHCTTMIKGGDVAVAVEEAIHETKRVEFVLVDSQAIVEGMNNVSVPVVSVSSDPNHKGDNVMSAHSESSKSTVLAKTAGYGLASAACYAAVFTHANSVAQVFAKGGLYAALPIVTVLAFSFVHGAFAHNLWSLLGIEAAPRDSARKTEVVQKRKVQRQRPRAYAQVNPFHNMDQ
ncbi:MAG: hypothetical protein P4L55_19410 [Syntrophobacteraceae bacterium]|nr:hypothetical protein [Syntrophobacteraceae bacterium]